MLLLSQKGKLHSFHSMFLPSFPVAALHTLHALPRRTVFDKRHRKLSYFIWHYGQRDDQPQNNQPSGQTGG